MEHFVPIYPLRLGNMPIFYNPEKEYVSLELYFWTIYMRYI